MQEGEGAAVKEVAKQLAAAEKECSGLAEQVQALGGKLEEVRPVVLLCGVGGWSVGGRNGFLLRWGKD
eukprot:1276940-Rhodomonas_salina.1